MLRLVAGVWLFIMGLAAGSAAQTREATQNVEVEPVTCWWRTTVSSVRMGEPFTVLLTCSILESDAARAVVDRSRLGSAAVQFPPYEVTGGSQSPDHVTAGRRFIQYDYTLRLITEEAFGTDVPIPEMQIAYRIESRVQADSAIQGREQTYVLPPLPMRVTSLVPVTASHIRETGVPTFAEISARELRARMFRLVALILFGIAALTVAIAVVRWVSNRRTSVMDVQRHLVPHRTVLSAVRRELKALQLETRAGWTSESLGRALAAARLVGSYLADAPISQRVLSGNAAAGELAVTRGWLSSRRIAVSGTTTAGALSRAATTNPAVASSEMEVALFRLTTARYGRNDTLESSALDDALASSARAADRVASRYTWVAELLASLKQGARGWLARAWAR